MQVPDDCRRCAACCFSRGTGYVAVTGQDWSRLGPEADRLAHFIGHRAYMRMVDGHCAALAWRRIDAARVEFHCTIYERRPQVCRDLARGSPQCEAELAGKTPLQSQGAGPIFP